VSIKVIINADDFGLSKQVSEDIIKCVEAGSITSISILPLKENIEFSLSLLEKINIDTGLHFYLTDFIPVSEQIRTVFTEPLTTRKLIAHLVIGKITERHIYYELSKQWEILESQGLSLSHISVHRQLNAIPKINKVLLQFAKERNVFVRMPSLAWCVPNPLSSLVKKINTKLNKSLINKGLPVVPSVSIFEKCSVDFDLNDYVSILRNAGSELVSLIVHPIRLTNCMSQNKTFCRISHREHEIFTSTSIAEFLRNQGFEPIGYRDISSSSHI